MSCERCASILDDIGLKYLHALKKHILLLHKELGTSTCDRCNQISDLEQEEVSADTLERLKEHIKSLHDIAVEEIRTSVFDWKLIFSGFPFILTIILSSFRTPH
ncbi:MAG: hypothetical protein WBZ36_11200 [Candidatus Nitrosopolaris sp.]